MKIIKYKFLSCEINHGTEEEPNIEQVVLPKQLSYSEEALEIARRESYNGEEPEIFDDGRPEPTTPTNENITWDTMAEAIREGVNEV